MALPTSGLVLSLDAAPANITLNGPDVSGFADTSSAANHGTQGSAAFQPLYEVTGWGGVYPSLLINGETSGEHLTFDTGTLPAALSGDDTPYTINLPCQVTTNPTIERYLWSAGNSGATVQILTQAIRSDDRLALFQRSDASVLSAAGEAVSSFDTGRHQFTAHFDGTTRTFYKNGVSIGTSTTALGACTFNLFTLGIMRRTTLNEGVNFRTPGMQIYNRALTASELRDVWRYNRSHFGGLSLASDLLRSITYVEIGSGVAGLTAEVPASAAFSAASTGAIDTAFEVVAAAALESVGAGEALLAIETPATATLNVGSAGSAVLVSESAVPSGHGSETLTMRHASTETFLSH